MEKLMSLICRRRVSIWIAILSAILLGGCHSLQKEPYKVLYSPDKTHRLEVYAYSTKSSFPGQGGDAPGMVMLKNDHGVILHKQSVEMVQLIDAPEWTSNSVTVKLILEWKF
jgi:hypothetical protein